MLDIVEPMPDTTDLQTQLSTNVKVLMAVHNLTQTELAKRLGWDLSVLSNRFHGKRQWKIDDLADLAHIFGLPAGALLGPTAEVVAAAEPALTAVKGSVTLRKLTQTRRPITGNAQVIELEPRRRLAQQGVTPEDAPEQTMMSHVG